MKFKAWPAVSLHLFAVMALAGLATRADAQPAPGKWEKEPDSYRGVKWGAAPEEAATKMEGAAGSLEELRTMKKVPDRCYCEYGKRQDLCTPVRDESVTTRMCFSTLTLDGTVLEEEWHFSGGNSYAGTALAFDTDEFGKMRDIFVQRYGPPTATMEEPFQTRGGAKSTNEILVWKGSTATVKLERYAGTISKGRASVLTNAWSEEAERQEKEERERGAKEF